MSSRYVDVMNNFGELFLPGTIQETSEEIVGYKSQKDFLHDFFSAVKTIAEMKDSELPFGVSLSALLTGPPGTGKTSLAKAMSKEYGLPIFLVYADSLIGSILGKTLNNIRDALAAAHQYAQNEGPIVVFFDELDAIASERSSVYEVGEIKRAVVTLLQRMDAILASKDPIAFLGATNHQHLLDSAVWRRFCYHISFPFPDQSMRKEIVRSFLKQLESSYLQVKLSDYQLDTLASETVTGGFTGADLKRGVQIAVLRALKGRVMTEQILLESLQSAGGTQQHIENEKRMSGREVGEQLTQQSTSSSSRPRTKKVF